MVNPYLEGNFAPVLEERTDDHDLEVTGVVPPDLEGQLLRNGPNPASIPADVSDYHWFRGDGMIHAIGLAGSRATGYRNRWVRTRALAAQVASARPNGPTEPIDGPANTHVIRHAGTTLALVESGFPHAVSPELDRARIHDFDGALSSPMTAHPKVDPTTGELLFFGYDLFGPPFLRFHVVDGGGQLTRTEEIEIPRAVMMHDFGVTTDRVVFLDQPVVFDLGLVAQGRQMPFRWTPEAGSRVGVLARDGRPDDIEWTSMDPGYVFHVVNAFDDGDATVLDVIRYDSVFDTDPGEVFTRCSPSMWRWTIDPAANRVSEDRLDDTPVEFPRIDPAVAGLPHRYAYAVRTGDDPEQPTFEGLVKYDLTRDNAVRFDPGPGRAPGEPVFVRAADGTGEDEGWVLSVVFDAARGASDLVILDATSFAGPPVATVHLPTRVPFGFHGSWVPSDS
jgi:carotenoid cleavage dioxygenase-like enzyme